MFSVLASIRTHFWVLASLLIQISTAIHACSFHYSFWKTWFWKDRLMRQRYKAFGLARYGTRVFAAKGLVPLVQNASAQVGNVVALIKEGEGICAGKKECHG